MSGPNLAGLLAGIGVWLAVIGSYWRWVYGPARRETCDRREASRVVADDLLDWLAWVERMPTVPRPDPVIDNLAEDAPSEQRYRPRHLLL